MLLLLLLEGVEIVEAVSNCSSADGGRKILSPGSVLLLFGATLKTADHVNEFSIGVAMSADIMGNESGTMIAQHLYYVADRRRRMASDRREIIVKSVNMNVNVNGFNHNNTRLPESCNKQSHPSHRSSVIILRGSTSFGHFTYGRLQGG